LGGGWPRRSSPARPGAPSWPPCWCGHRRRSQPTCGGGIGCPITNDAADFLATRLDLVVEVAGHEALKAYAEDVLRQGKDLLLISVGAFADAALQERVWRLAHDRGRRVYLATGAIAGLDAIASARSAGWSR
jgi:aspartate dehydrogenase